MFINKIKLQNFRNFKQNEFIFNSRVVVIEGKNGSGKTSLLESLYYTCFLKSFRTHQRKDLITINDNYFFTQLDFDDEFKIPNQIQIGLSAKDGKLVKFNKNPITSYKQILSQYKVISIAEDDLSLVQGAPEERRTFLNQFQMLLELEFIKILKEYKQILQQRNELIFNSKNLSLHEKGEFYIWSKQLWEKTIIIQKQRIDYLKKLEKEVNNLLVKYLEKENLSISFKYKSKKIDLTKTFDEFWNKYPEKIKDEELRWGRSMFGAHLDDFLITFQEKKARAFASRGQQKLILFLLKIAQLMELQKTGKNAILLIDDFLTDFDENRLNNCLNIIQKINSQIFITCPLISFISSNFSNKIKYQIISL